MTFGSLFAGIGGFDLGFERAGMECKWQVEIDPFCQRILAKHWPNVTRYGDIEEVDFEQVERVDVICGGFPCQPVSRASHARKHQSDERWLLPAFLRAIRSIRPRFAIMENVPGLRDRGFADVLGGLAEIGFDAEWESIPAAAFGAKHLRERVWVVAHANTLGSTQGVTPEPCEEIHDNERRSGSLGAFNGDFFHGLDPYTEASRGESWRRRVMEHEPKLVRRLHGLPDELDVARLESLGNAVIPQIPEWIGRRIMVVAA